MKASICARAAFSDKFLCGAATPVLAVPVPVPVDGGGGGDGAWEEEQRRGWRARSRQADLAWRREQGREEKCKDDVSPHGQRQSRVHFGVDSWMQRRIEVRRGDRQQGHFVELGAIAYELTQTDCGKVHPQPVQIAKSACRVIENSVQEWGPTVLTNCRKSMLLRVSQGWWKRGRLPRVSGHTPATFTEWTYLWIPKW